MEPANPLLPALGADTPSLLRRAGGLLNAVRGIQQEANAEYWYELGLVSKQAEDWQQALYCFDRVIKMDTTHWRGRLFSGLSQAHLKQVEPCMAAIFGAEMHGRPKRESDLFSFYALSESLFLSDFLDEQKGESKQYPLSAALALVHFYNRNLELAEQLLLDAEIENLGQESWKQYFLSRIAFEKGDIEASIIDLNLPLFCELAKNPRVQFWVGRSCIQSIKGLENQGDFCFCEGMGDYYLPDETEQRVNLGIKFLNKSVSINPVCAEYRFMLGEALQCLDSPRWNGSGAALNEYHAAVVLDPGNEQYIMARYFAASYSYHLDDNQVLELVSRVEAADINLSNESLVRNATEDLRDTGNYASCLLLFNKSRGFIDQSVLVVDSEFAYITQWMTECIASLGGVPSMAELRVLANAERAKWEEVLKKQAF